MKTLLLNRNVLLPRTWITKKAEDNSITKRFEK